MKHHNASSPPKPKLTKAVNATIVAFVIALLAVAWIPNFIPARVCTTMDTCVFNQLWIETAKRLWAAENQKSAHDIPSDTEVLAYLRKTTPMWDGSQLPPNLVPRHVPVCYFSHCAYTFGSVSQPVRCNGHVGHRWSDPEYRRHYGVKRK